MKETKENDKNTFWFNKLRKVDQKWDDSDRSAFKNWRMRAENYLTTGHEVIQEMVEWAVNQVDRIQLSEWLVVPVDGKEGVRVHQDFIDKHPQATWP